MTAFTNRAAQEAKVDPAYLELLKSDTIVLVGVVYENRLPNAANAILQSFYESEGFLTTELLPRLRYMRAA